MGLEKNIIYRIDGGHCINSFKQLLVVSMTALCLAQNLGARGASYGILINQLNKARRSYHTFVY